MSREERDPLDAYDEWRQDQLSKNGNNINI